MSYDLVLLPSGAATSPDEVDSYLSAQEGKPAGEDIVAIAAELDKRNSELPEADSFLGAPAADGVLGETLFVSTPYDAIGHTRGLLFELAREKFAVWDPQLAWLIDPGESVTAAVTHGGAGEFPYLTRQLVDAWVPGLGQPGPYLIAETDDQVYIQTYRHPDGHYDIEYRDGSADKHFAASVNDPRIVADLIWGWATGDRSGFSALEWQRLTF